MRNPKIHNLGQCVQTYGLYRFDEISLSIFRRFNNSFREIIRLIMVSKLNFRRQNTLRSFAKEILNGIPPVSTKG